MIGKKALGISAGVVVLAGAILVGAFWFANRTVETGLELENGTVGIMPGVDLDERMRELQTQLDKSKIAFSINTSPLFASATGEGNLMLENPANNAKLIAAKMVRRDNGGTLYTSKALVPGSYLENVRLDTVPVPGEYPVVVYLTAYDQETQEYIGQTGAEITITVE